MAADAHTVTLLDTKNFVGTRRQVLCTLDVTNYNSTTGSVITAAECGLSRIIYITATDAAAGFEPFVVEASNAVHLRVSTTGVEVATDVNVHTTAPIAANLVVIGV